MKKNGCHFLVNWNIFIRVVYFRFGSVFIKKNNQIKILKKNQNRFKPTGFCSVQFFQFGSVFSVLTQFFRFWLGFFWFFSIQFQVYKIELVGFFKILICFFHDSIIFFNFLDLINFSVFLLNPNIYY